MTNYENIYRQISALIDGVPYKIANLANIAACLFEAIPDINWAGFYLEEDGLLVLGPFVGKPACVSIAPGRGVCGTAFVTDQTQRVEDVHAFPGHIACDADSRSEIVVPLHKDGRVVGVLDIDSPREARFTEADRAGLEAVARLVEACL